MTEQEHDRLTALEERAKSNTKRLDRLEQLTDAIHEQNEAIRELVVELKHTNEHVADHDKRLTAIEKRPGERLSQIVTAIISAIAGALITGMVGAVVLFR